MRFPVFDFRRNGKSHMPGSAASVPTATLRKKPEVLFNPTVKMLSSFGFAPTPRSRKAAWARKPAILKNRINKNVQLKASFRISGRAGRLPLGRPGAAGHSSRAAAALNRTPRKLRSHVKTDTISEHLDIDYRWKGDERKTGCRIKSSVLAETHRTGNQPARQP